jgi:nucleoid-associated protein YgaU
MAPPPPAGGETMAPPPSGGDTIAPPPADKLFPEEPKKEEPKKSKKKKGSKSAYRTAVQYDVAKHDSLWKISRKVYGDAFSWPLVFIANRDLIKDPDLIQPSWDLKVNRNASTDEISQAVQKAKETPRFEPHMAPRKKLPVDY